MSADGVKPAGNRLFLKKSIAQIQKEAAKSELKRTLGPLNLMSLGIGAILGAGAGGLDAALDPANFARERAAVHAAVELTDGADFLARFRRTIAWQRIAALAARRGVQPLARIVGHTTFSHQPEWFTTAPVGAISALLDKVGWTIADVDLFEINEAFAVVAMAPIKELGIPHAKVNVNGGACALGHPIGASGARLVVTLVNALRKRGLKRGVAALCIGGGEATAIAVEVA